MRSVLLRLGPFAVYSYGLMLAIGVLTTITVIRPRAAAIGLREERLFNLAAGVFTAALAGARLTWPILAGERAGSQNPRISSRALRFGDLVPLAAMPFFIIFQ